MEAPSITIALRIPGQWSHPRELIQRLPAGCRLTAEALILPDATQVEFGAMRGRRSVCPDLSLLLPAAGDGRRTGDGRWLHA